MAGATAGIDGRSSLASLAVTAFAAFALASAPTAAAQETLAASCEPQEDGVGVFGSDLIAQGFTSQVSGHLTRAEVSVRDDPGNSADWVVQIRTAQPSDDPGFEAEFEPTTVVLASATVSDSGVPEDEFFLLNAVFPTPATVAAGQKYAVVITRPAAAQLTVGLRDAASCPGQAWDDEELGNPPGALWRPFEVGGDLVFRVFVTPPVTTNCRGEQATIVGTPGGDEIAGTAGRDVIAALAGKDKVSGLSGKDLICGGSGKDTLKGGKGKDKLLGQEGADALKGGQGNDTCKGGKGRDEEKSC